MKLSLRGSLPFVTFTLHYNNSSLEIADVLVDTGSASTVLSSDLVAQIGIVPEASDRLRTLRGVGGRELVFTRRLDRLEVVGMDYLTRTRAILDLRNLTLD
jgi:predicted aspartyl protease